MSGGLLSSFRKGNRAELLADYLLSSIGICTPVRRQDDYGFDFYCQLSDQESGYLTFGSSFMIQMKSNMDNVTYPNSFFLLFIAETLVFFVSNCVDLAVQFSNHFHSELSNLYRLTCA